LKKLNIKKGELLQSAGELNSKIYVVESGLLRSYSIDEKGKEHIFTFAPEGWIMADNISPHKESLLYIDALEDAVVIQKEKNFETEAFKEEVEVQKLIKRVGVLQERIIMLMSATAIDRYRHFIETYPEIVQRVPQRMIASYLGITPEALSTVKKSYLNHSL
jgi:CRP-like cAMP-binding protein